jgi:hypothetical protein
MRSTSTVRSWVAWLRLTGAARCVSGAPAAWRAGVRCQRRTMARNAVARDGGRKRCCQLVGASIGVVRNHPVVCRSRRCAFAIHAYASNVRSQRASARRVHVLTPAIHPTQLPVRPVRTASPAPPDRGTNLTLIRRAAATVPEQRRDIPRAGVESAACTRVADSRGYSQSGIPHNRRMSEGATKGSVDRMNAPAKGNWASPDHRRLSRMDPRPCRPGGARTWDFRAAGPRRSPLP